MKQQDCIFCKIAAGEIPSATIYEDESFKVILDIAPASKGHSIIIPKKHVANIYEISEEDASKVFVLASKIGKVMKEELGCDGLNILQNNGEAAGQSVFHIHIHLIPRFKNDNITLSWKPEKYEVNEMEHIADSIRKKL